MDSNLVIDSWFFGNDPDELIDVVLKNRGIEDPDSFLNPDESYIRPPQSLARIDEAGKILKQALENGKKIFLNVDSDTDGVTSGTIIKRYIEHCWPETQVFWWISQGKTHGTSYELTGRLEEVKPDVLVIVDSLDSELDNYIKYKEMGIDVLVLDHHDIDPETPYDDYVVLVSSNRSENKELSGAGVCWKFCKYMDQITENDYADELADLAAVGMVADMMKLDADHMENRAIVKKGLDHLVSQTLKKIVGGFDFNTQAVSFSIAPLINACCRYNENDTAFEAFISDDPDEISRLIKVMRRCKEEQREEVAACSKELKEQFKEQEDQPVLCGFIDTANGINGLIANQATQKYQKPVLILNTQSKNGTLTGSGRSCLDTNLRQDCQDTRKAKAKGHPNAFGLFVKDANMDEFLKRIRKKYSSIEFKKDIHADVEVEPEALTVDLVDAVKLLNHITGLGFKQIQVAVTLHDYWVETMTQGKHLVFKDGNFTYIKWNAGDMIGEYEGRKDPITLVGTLDAGFFGRKFVPRMVIDEIV